MFTLDISIVIAVLADMALDFNALAQSIALDMARFGEWGLLSKLMLGFLLLAHVIKAVFYTITKHNAVVSVAKYQSRDRSNSAKYLGTRLMDVVELYVAPSTELNPATTRGGDLKLIQDFLKLRF